MNAPARLADAMPLDTTVLVVPAMHCAGCMGKVERAFSGLPGVHSARVNLTARQVRVEHEASVREPDLMAALERSIPLGRGGTPDEAAGAVYLLCIPESDYVSGQTLLCSGGLTGI